MMVNMLPIIREDNPFRRIAHAGGHLAFPSAGRIPALEGGGSGGSWNRSDSSRFSMRRWRASVRPNRWGRYMLLDGG